MGVYHGHIRDKAGNISNERNIATITTADPDENGYFSQNGTIDGGSTTCDNPIIPAGFAPYEDETVAEACWTVNSRFAKLQFFQEWTCD